MSNPRWIKRVDEVPGVDEHGTPFTKVTVHVRWWYLLIAWFNQWRSRSSAPAAREGK